MDEKPKYLLRDRDAIYGKQFSQRAQTLGIKEVLTAYRSPWQNPYAERVIGSIHRECLDHVIVLGPRHLKQILIVKLEIVGLITVFTIDGGRRTFADSLGR